MTASTVRPLSASPLTTNGRSPAGRSGRGRRRPSTSPSVAARVGSVRTASASPWRRKGRTFHSTTAPCRGGEGVEGGDSTSSRRAAVGCERSSVLRLQGLADAVLTDPTLAATLGDIESVDALDLTGPAGLRPFVVEGLADRGRTVLAVTATQREAEDLVESLADLIDADTVGFFPSWETLPHERLSPRSDTIGRRLAVLRRIVHPEEGELRVVVAPVRSLLQPQVKGLGDLTPVVLHPGDTVEPRRRRPPAVGRGVTPRSTWWRSAASSPSAAASSTSSRPPRSTRRALSSGATSSRRCAPSRPPTSAPGDGRPALGAAVPRAAARRRVRRRAADSARSTRRWPRSPRSSPRASPSRAWSRWRPR